ncbi:phosphatidylinositol 4,5-bisphosphate 3-kinase catalytic subunit beta isoform-like [Rhipicephalus microplus]|uniref:phosphatidylinositol 4,5-bisphosphate 3-kinase catalytic subunit beta isoform-like n=1 Tax=Rhipicephalus microplus TaxID=6941 RepID=UPI003F6AAD34
MIPPGSGLLDDPWISGPSDSLVEVTVLLPNGLLLLLQVHKESTLEQVKECTWREARQRPLYRVLRDRDAYVFTCVSERTSEREEFTDEERRLCDVRPFQALLKLVDRRADKTDRAINTQIGLLIGRGVNSFEALQSAEVNDFRRNMRAFCSAIADQRAEWPPLEQVKYRYPARVDRCSSQFPPPHMADRVTGDTAFDAHILLERGGSLIVCTSVSATPRQLLQQVMQNARTEEQFLCHTVESLVLKVCGREEYLLEELPLLQYKYVQDKISEGTPPQFLIVPISDIQTDHDIVYAQIEQRDPASKSSRMVLDQCKCVSAWTIKEAFRVRVVSASAVNVEPGAKLAVDAGLYHGTELLCETRRTNECAVNDDGQCSWDQELEFTLPVQDVPNAARLCLVMYEVTKGTKGGAQRSRRRVGPDLFAAPLAWGNVTTYDYRGVLRSGMKELSLWAYADDPQADEPAMLNPMGTAVSNPDRRQATHLILSFHSYDDRRLVCFPKLDEILECAASCVKEQGSSAHGIGHASKSHREQLRQIAEQDPLAPVHEQDKQLLWFLRYDCLELPHSLPKLLLSLRWGQHQDVAMMQALLQIWKLLKPEQALELLDYSYPDNFVRSFAVRCLHQMDDEELSLYLLQLVQALKHESYLECDLVKFLLERALKNRHIGHQMFWLLRCEMHVAALSVKFGLILEAYCHGAPEHREALLRQAEALFKLRTLGEQVHLEASKRKDSREKLVASMQEIMSKETFRITFRNLCSPLDPCHVFSCIKPEKCRFMDSKMKPLWLVFENSDSAAEDIAIIFKYGDDLRQDMLTLQMIRIMDKIWKDEGYDFRMIPYQCLSTDHNVGLIEVVRRSNTIANIQKLHNSSATSAFKKGSLLAWIKDHNKTPESLKKAVENFTLSCAGYCVATYVLGVADRHSDNIMIKANGELFHIDYGHILGKFKEKFGIKRERVPFVLTHDFVHVITHGRRNKSASFNRFQQLCEEAFIILRRHGSLIISLFAMMLTTGMPELTSEKDLDYLRDTLVLDYSEGDALAHFRAKFEEALSNSWTTSINWFAHNISKDNK